VVCQGVAEITGGGCLRIGGGVEIWVKKKSGRETTFEEMKGKGGEKESQKKRKNKVACWVPHSQHHKRKRNRGMFVEGHWALWGGKGEEGRGEKG